MESQRVPTKSRGTRPWLRPALLAAGAAAAWLNQSTAPATVRAERDLSQAITNYLRIELQLSAQPHDLRIVEQTGGVRRQVNAVVSAHRAGEPRDLYFVRATLSPEGYLLRPLSVEPLTDTTAADESRALISGSRLLYSTQAGNHVAIGFLDLDGQDAPAAWPWLARVQDRLTKLQETGRMRGIRRAIFTVDPGQHPLTYGFEQDHLWFYQGESPVRVRRDLASRPSQTSLQIHAQEQAQPARFLNWSVDRLRSSSWVGDERLQVAKALGFSLRKRLRHLLPASNDVEQIRRELGTQLRSAHPASHSAESPHFPPAPMQPWVSPPLAGEGEWETLDGDPFIQTNQALPSPFATSFIRTDAQQAGSQVYVTLWDPRQVALSVVSGTEEPQSATGLTGSGRIPRTPAVMSRVVAAFNGAFLGRHGHFGIKSDGHTLIPPKAYAATIAELSGGTTGFGTWPATPTAVPARILSFRQNMTPLIVDGTLNPYKRHWWGGTPEGWEDDALTVRSGLCMTRNGFVAYFYGNNIDPTQLGRAMQKAACTYGVHLDMNPGHVGLEFYRIEQAGKLPTFGRRLEPEWETQGPVPDLPGFEFQARRMLRYMALMQFPRYLERQRRDFFYLTLKHLLPGENLKPLHSPPSANEGQWKLIAGADPSSPSAFARTEIRPTADTPRISAVVFKLDPKQLRLARDAAASDTVLGALRSPTRPFVGSTSVWLTPSEFVVAPSAPTGEAVQWVGSGLPPDDPRVDRATAALGVTGEGMLLYAELEGGAALPGRLFADFMKHAGAAATVLLARNLGLECAPPTSMLRGVTLIVRRQTSSVERLFPATQVVEPATWAPLQGKSVPHVGDTPTLGAK